MWRLLLLSALAGCGGAVSTGPGDASAAGDASGGGHDGTAGNDGGTGGPDTGSSPLTPDPGQVRCGTDTCTPPVTACCVEPDGGTLCVGQQICNGRTIGCDETGDCTSGDVCCYSPAGAGFPDVFSACAPHDCIRNSIAYQACKSTADCAGTGMLCVAQTCGGVVFGTCGGIAPADCH